MGQVRHGSATTTHAVRAAIQRSQASLATLSRELGINPKTVAKRRTGETVEDLKTGPKAPHSTTLSEAEEAVVVAFRRHTLLPLDDCLYALQPSLPHLTCSALHRCLQRHGISCLPDVEGEKPTFEADTMPRLNSVSRCLATLALLPTTTSHATVAPGTGGWVRAWNPSPLPPPPDKVVTIENATVYATARTGAEEMSSALPLPRSVNRRNVRT